MGDENKSEDNPGASEAAYVHGAKIIPVIGSSYFSDRMIQMQPFAGKPKATNMSHSDDPSAKIILALGSCSFHVDRAVVMHVFIKTETKKTPKEKQ